jgi:hypothetical protein
MFYEPLEYRIGTASCAGEPAHGARRVPGKTCTHESGFYESQGELHSPTDIIRIYSPVGKE